MRRILITGCLVTSLVAASVFARDEGLSAGAAAVNIDPPNLPVIQNGGFTQRTANTVSQSLYARSLVLEDDYVRIAICVVDSCMLDRELCDRAKLLVKSRTGIPEDRILISATHTHTAPSAMRALGTPPDPEYPGFLVLKIVDSIAAAAKTVRPAEIGWAVADANLYTHPRRWIYLPHKIRTDPYGKRTVRAMMHPGYVNPDTSGPSGPDDPDLTLLSIRQRESGKLLAVLGNLSQHYYAEGRLSSGYTGLFCTLLEQEFGSPFVGLMSQGTSGDLQHRDYSRPKNDQPFAGEDNAYQAYCRGLAGLAIKALKKVDYRTDCKLAMEEAKLLLKRRMPDQERIAWAKAIVDAVGDRLPKNRPEVLAQEVFWILENPKEELKLQAIRIGQYGIATLPNEVYGITGLKLKLQSPLRPLMNIELANGSAGYIPPPEQHQLGGYTTWPARTAGLEVQAEPKIVETLLGLLEKISGDKRRAQVDRIDAHGEAVLSLRPTAYWRMSAHSGDTIVDASGHDATGKLEPGYALFLDGPKGKANESATTERGNRAVHFAGGRMVATEPTLNRGSDYSASLWFWNAMPHNVRKVTGYCFSLGHDKNPQSGDHLGITGTVSDTPGRLLFYNGDDDKTAVIGRTKLKRQHWHHVLLVREGENVRVYLDGRSDPEIDATVADTRPAKATDVFVGGRSDSLFNFEGKIDEVALFARALPGADNPVRAVQESSAVDNSDAVTAPQPNVLFIGVDDLRPELGCYGADYIQSPNVDRLAAEGVLFERAYCQWAVCMPSRASLLSGLRPDSFGGKANQFRAIVPDVVTLPQHFKNNGYYAQSFGKIYHGSWETAYVGNSFQDSVSWSAPRFASSPRYYFTEEGVRIARKVFYGSNDRFLSRVTKDPADPHQWTNYFVRGLATEAPDISDDLPGDGQVAVAALKKLRELHNNQQPFFLAVGFMKPHLPFVAPKRYWDLYAPDKIPRVAVPDRPKGAPDFAVKQGAGEVNQYVNKSQGLLSPERTRHLRHGYAACVSYVDAQIGRLLNELDALGIRNNTIVVLWSDHGYKLGDFGAWAKHTNFELDTRVPLIVSAPGLPMGRRSQAIVELVDLHPTLSELAGLPIHPGAEGQSFATNVSDPESAGQDAAFSQFPKAGFMGYTIRTPTHRYTEWRRTKGPNRGVAARELYEYGRDNIERVNVAGRPEFQAIQETLQKQLHAMISSTK